MKKILSMLLVMVMIFSIGVFATEATDTQAAETVDQSEIVSDVVEEEEIEQIYFKSKIIEASEVGEKTYMISYYGQEMEYPVTGQDLKLVVQEGKYKGVEISLVYPLGEQGATEYEDPLKVGDKVYVYVTENAQADGTVTYDGEIVLPIDSTREIVIYATIVALLVLIVLLARTKSIRIIGVIVLNIAILFFAFGFLYLKTIPAIATLAITAILMIITNTIIINNFSKKTLVAIIGIMVATILTTSLCMFMINITNISESFEVGTNAEGETGKPEYIDVIIGTMVIASLGISINMALKTANEHAKGEGTIHTIKVISAELVRCLNGALLIITGALLTNVFYVAFQNYPIHMILFGENNVFIELIKIIVVMVNPIIVIPITAILSKLLVEPTKGIDEAK
ncbi:MAG: YibE/F family protein [Clostridiales bacterium]|nr:YibE/F family protein [Clostridiales bacterium]